MKLGLRPRSAHALLAWLAPLLGLSALHGAGCKIDDRNPDTGDAGPVREVLAESAAGAGGSSPMTSGGSGGDGNGNGNGGSESPPVALPPLPIVTPVVTTPADAGAVPVALGAASPATSVVALSSAQMVVGEIATVTLTAHDASGQRLLRGADAVAFRVTGEDFTATLGPVVDHGDGTYTATFVGSRPSTPLSITAILNGANVTTPAALVQIIRYSNRVLSFDGTNEYLSVGDLVLPSGSLSLWLQTAAPDGYLISKVQAGGSSSGELRLLLNAGRALFRIEGSGVAEIQSDSLLNDSRWHHLMVDFNPGLRMIVDGVVQSDQNFTNTSGMQITGATLEIGRNNALENGYYAGLLDEIAIYSGSYAVELARQLAPNGVPGELRGLSNAGDLLHWWRLGESDTPPTLRDVVGGLSATMVEMSALNLVTIER
jgi:hypothetical protein